MPKKPPRNSFYFYMIDFREEQKAKGIVYQSMAQVAEAAGPLWKDAPPSIRSKYDKIAKQEKLRNNIPDLKFTSTGISLAEIDRREKEARDAADIETKDIQNVVKLKAFNQSINREPFYLMDVNYYCKVGSDYVFCECSLLGFSLSDGLREEYHHMVHPGPIPLGYASDAKIACIELGVDMPDEDKKRSNYKEILANVLDFLHIEGNHTRSSVPIIYTMPDKIQPVQNFIQQMCIRAAYDETIFRIYHLNKMFYYLINAIKTSDNEGFPKPSLSLTQLERDCFKYHAGLGCIHHEAIDKAAECTTSRVKRWAFTVLDHCCPVAGVDMVPGKHLPVDLDLDKILELKEKRRQATIGSSVSSVPRSSNSSLSESVDGQSTSSQSHNFSAEASSKTSHLSQSGSQRRFAKMNYAKAFVEPPTLSENDFPTLSTGIGRGRGMVRKAK